VAALMTIVTITRGTGTIITAIIKPTANIPTEGYELYPSAGYKKQS